MKDTKKNILRMLFVALICIAMLIPVGLSMSASAAPAKTPLDGSTVPKFTSQLLADIPVYVPIKVKDPQTGLMTDYYTIIASQFSEQILPTGYPKTTVWGYGGNCKDPLTGAFLGFVRNSPGPTIEATRGTPVNVAWVNGIYTKYMFATDPTVDWTNPNNMVTPTTPFNAFPPGYAQAQYPVTIATHLHGGETSAKYDGGPFNWVSWNGLHGPDYNTYTKTLPNAAVFHYDNQQAVGTLWFHDHAMGLTRSNVYSGLAGYYMLRDPADPIKAYLPSGKYEVPLAIQDRKFFTDGSLMFPSDSPPNPTIHPYWVPEFFGNVIMVNGVAWPNLNVDSGQYLFKVLDGSNARWYNLSMSNGMPFTVIASDENYLRSAVTVTSFQMAPGERYDVLVDFTGMGANTKIVMTNNAPAPFNTGYVPDAATNGTIMQFTVSGNPGFAPKTLPTILNPTLKTYPSLGMANVTVTRQLTLKEWQGPNGPQMVTLDGQQYSNPISELPHVNATEIWKIVDDTVDGHPIHWHLVNVQVIERQAYNQSKYDTDWLALNGGQLPFTSPTKNVNLNNYLIGSPTPASPYEQAWKDTVQANPGEVVTVIVRFAPAGPTLTSYPFDVTQGPDYVWHCHIVDHEDQDMIRPYRVVP
ncbi:MAG TPA: multicopper oxidase [Methanomassiliicoccales archaeon]|jgi:FtsP/CotA-like multicopper oxidase with cupredoxin domain